LPPDSKQHAAVVSRIDALTREIDTAEPLASGTNGAPLTSEQETGARERGGAGPSDEPIRKKGVAAALLAAGALLLKFKSLLLLLLTKGKLLLLGLTKGSTLLTMIASFGVYWTLWGWKFAAGFVLSIYVHEMGHV